MQRSPFARALERRAGLGVLSLPGALVRRLAGAPIVRRGDALDAHAQLSMRLARTLGEKQAPDLGPVRYREELDHMGVVLAPDPPALAEVRDLSWGERGLRARLYVPEGLRAPSPGLVYLHGGGFVAGSLASHDPVCRALAVGARCRVVSFEYRLAPEHPFPAAADDALAAWRFARAEAASLGLDPARLALGGDSAGGNLTAVTALAARGAESPIAQLLLYPALDMTMTAPSLTEYAEGFFLERRTMFWFRDQYLSPKDDRKDPRCSPAFAPDVAGAAPAIVVTAGFDPLRDEGQAYAAKLREAGVPVVERFYPGLFHGFLHAGGAIPSARAAVDEIAGELRRALG